MMEVIVLGSGCKRCEATEQMLRAEAARLGVDITVKKVTDFAEIAKFGIVSTPGVVVDGKVVHAGGLPKAADLARWLAPAA